MSIIFFFVPNLTFLLITSLFCQKAALAIPILAFNSSSHLASSVIQLPKYLYRFTCSNAMLFKVMEHFTLLAVLITIILVFFTFLHISSQSSGEDGVRWMTDLFNQIIQIKSNQKEFPNVMFAIL